MTTPLRPFGAVLTAMVTPMRHDGSIDFDAVKRVASFLVENGNDGIVVSGTTGESPTTHAPEKVDLLLAVREAVGPNVTIVAGAGSNDTAHAVRMAEQAAEAGADALLSVTPYYSRPSQPGVVAHISQVAEATDLPVMLYDIPGRTGLRLSDETLDQLAAHDNIIAVKDATGDVPAAKRVMERTGLIYYSGDDPLNLEFLRAGAAGMVSVASHLASPAMVRMVAAHDAGDDAAADAAHAECMPIIDALMGAGLGAVMAKAALEAIGVLESRDMRLPHLAASPHEYDVLVAALKSAGVAL